MFFITLGSQFDQITVSGSAQFGGALNISLSGGFNPNVNDGFQVINFGSRSGNFASINGLNLGNNRFFTSNFSANSLTLSVVEAKLSIITPTPNQLLSVNTTSTVLTVSLDNHTGHWHWQLNANFPNSGVAGGNMVTSGNSATITGLANGQTYAVHTLQIKESELSLQTQIPYVPSPLEGSLHDTFGEKLHPIIPSPLEGEGEDGG